MMQGGRDWWHTLDDAYQTLGYRTSCADSCVRTKVEGDKHTITNMFTDDTFGLSTTLQGGKKAKRKLGQMYKIKDLRTLLSL